MSPACQRVETIPPDLRRPELESRLTPMMAFSSCMVTCLALSTAAATCCWCCKSNNHHPAVHHKPQQHPGTLSQCNTGPFHHDECLGLSNMQVDRMTGHFNHKETMPSHKVRPPSLQINNYLDSTVTVRKETPITRKHHLVRFYDRPFLLQGC